MEKLAIQSDKDQTIRVEEFISRFCDTKNIHNYYATITMSVLQAVENAIVHGNASDCSKKVIIEAGDCQGGVYVQVSDQGDGFDWKAYGDMPSKNGSGDGIFLMKMLSDSLLFDNNGSTVRMEFMVHGIDEMRAVNRINTLELFFAKAKETV